LNQSVRLLYKIVLDEPDAVGLRSTALGNLLSEPSSTLENGEKLTANAQRARHQSPRQTMKEAEVEGILILHLSGD